MTEAEWLAYTDPQKMLEFLRGKVSDRKLRLFACACCRRIWPLLVDGVSRKAVEVGERFADGLATEDERYSAYQAADDVWAMIGDAFDDMIMEPDNEWALAITAAGVPWFAAAEAADAAIAPVEDTLDKLAAYIPASKAAGWAEATGDQPDAQAEVVEQAAQANLVREIVGNPFRPVAVSPASLTPGVVELARTIYDERAFDRLTELADALQQAGCTYSDILAHCHQPGEHVRGCWVVDLLLGKE